LEKNNINYTHWFFDLDNTLYSANTGIFDQIHKKMGEFISSNLEISLEKAKFLQKKYFVENGTTLHGLMINHKINPKKFLNYVHDIDFSIVKPDKELNDLIKRIKGKKIIFTNADISYVKKILSNIDLDNVFDDIFDIERMNYLPKPNLETYKNLVSTYKFDTTKAILFDDIPQNLLPAADLGLKTVQVYNKKLDKELNGSSKKIHYITNNLKEWLKKWIQNN
tara:strand:- start:3269 stop:3937 length:669 start_codon:yes stop_codon:yes gene_type:complete